MDFRGSYTIQTLYKVKIILYSVRVEYFRESMIFFMRITKCCTVSTFLMDIKWLNELCLKTVCFHEGPIGGSTGFTILFTETPFALSKCVVDTKIPTSYISTINRLRKISRQLHGNNLRPLHCSHNVFKACKACLPALSRYDKLRCLVKPL